MNKVEAAINKPIQTKKVTIISNILKLLCNSSEDGQSPRRDLYKSHDNALSLCCRSLGTYGDLTGFMPAVHQCI
jgi:hypothetical protein